MMYILLLFRSGREWNDWSSELRVPGEEIKWKFNSDGSVNGWGWKFTVYPVMPATGTLNLHSDRYNLALKMLCKRYIEICVYLL